jgi:thiazole/oxazole-forming peptide maturase SagD family component
MARLTDADLSVRLLDISTDFPVPVVLAVVTGRDYPYATVGACCHPSLERACCKALDEAISVRVSLRHEKWQRTIPDFEDFDWVRQLEDHMVLYGSWPESPALGFLGASPKVPLETAKREYAPEVPDDRDGLIRFVFGLRDDLGLTVLASELECLDTAPFGHVVRVVVPEMMPLSQDHRARWLDTPRLHRRLSAGGTAINSAPHPFA